MDGLCLVEADMDLSALLHPYLEKSGYLVYPCNSQAKAQQYLNAFIPFWVIDIMLPDENGLELLKEVKKANPNATVILLSSKSDPFDRVAGFELGCDDFIAKPFLPAELTFRLKKLHPHGQEILPDSSSLPMGPYRLNLFKRSVFSEKAKVSLTSREFDIILFFLNHCGQAISREQLLNNVWGTGTYVSDRSVDNYIKNIRRKLPLLNLETIYAYGYRYNP